MGERICPGGAHLLLCARISSLRSPSKVFSSDAELILYWVGLTEERAIFHLLRVSGLIEAASDVLSCATISILSCGLRPAAPLRKFVP